VTVADATASGGNVRDLILFLALAGVIPLILRAPVVGLLAWMWITLMNPQREVYGFLSGFELNFYIAALTAMAWFVSKERKIVPINALTILLVLFGLWTCVTTYFALDPAYSMNRWDRTIKTIILALAVVTLTNTKSRFQAVVWIFMVSIGYYAVKGGGFVLLTGGSQHVYGPENTQIADNNSIGLALTVLLPLMNYLRVTSQRPIIRLACLAVMTLTFIAIIGTYSRGALVALAAAAAAYSVRSKAGVVVILLAAILMIALPSILPSSWLDRMSTIQSYNQDASFEGRVAAWKTSVNIAKARPLGGGFSAVDLDKVAEQFQSPGSLKKGRAAHSIYFEVLGDHGFVGLALYLLVLAAAGLNTSLVLGATRGRPDLEWANLMARMLQVSIVALVVGGAALSMAYYDGFIVILALTAALLQIVRQPAVESAPATSGPGWAQVAARQVAPTRP
jgi:probable O-glycosylation ligase (exosortase A-associated)